MIHVISACGLHDYVTVTNVFIFFYYMLLMPWTNHIMTAKALFLILFLSLFFNILMWLQHFQIIIGICHNFNKCLLYIFTFNAKKKKCEINQFSLILFLKEQKLIKGHWIFLNNKSEVLQRLSLSPFWNISITHCRIQTAFLIDFKQSTRPRTIWHQSLIVSGN